MSEPAHPAASLPPAARRVIARYDETLGARVVRVSTLWYADGADPSLDRPAHVRAGSGIAWAGPRLAVVQDDANFVALVDPHGGEAVAVALPAGTGGRRQFDDVRGNKAEKLDLEAVVAVPRQGGGPLVVALGSGSTARRERILTLRGVDERQAAGDTRIAVHEVPAFYARLREATAFAGSELNVEGAVYLGRAPGARLRLFNRGNGAPRDGRGPVNATCDVNWRALVAHLDRPEAARAPAPFDIVQYDLGEVGGLALTFTDAAVAAAASDPERLRVVYTAAAEASPDATRDGPVAGCAMGVIAEGAEGIRARWTLLRDEAGAPFAAKVEGVAPWPGDATRAYVVVDRDAPDVPSALCEVVLEGPWLADV